MPCVPREDISATMTSRVRVTTGDDPAGALPSEVAWLFGIRELKSDLIVIRLLSALRRIMSLVVELAFNKRLTASNGVRFG